LHARQTCQLFVRKRMLCTTAGASGFHKFFWKRTPFLRVSYGWPRYLLSRIESVTRARSRSGKRKRPPHA
jgi:hypothetical protein